jgi:putative GTP pyrophosphokinase
LNDTLHSQFSYSPIERIDSRIKSLDSVKKKLEKKGLKFIIDDIESINDIAGIRIICKFLDDIPEIIMLMSAWKDVEFIKKKDFINSPKDSGYRSYHIICALQKESQKITFEIQVRTLAMDFWATNEHLLKYKFGDDIPENARDELKEISEITATLDLKMNILRKDIHIGTASARIIEQIKKSITILEDIGFYDKAKYFISETDKHRNDFFALKSIAIRAKEAVPKQYWK